MIITISGSPGSGKSSVGKIIAKKLGYTFLSIGDLRGKIAIDKGITIDELNKIGEKENWPDKLTDDYQRELAKTHDNFVVEGRMSFYFIPQSFKIFLTADKAIAAKRVLQNRKDREDEGYIASPEEAEQKIKLRVESDKLRYQKYYGVDYTDPKHYDFVLDTTLPSAEEVSAAILDKITKKQ
ncbi:MAG: cytidylate kinase family protein [Patescibacteria group bacterium]|nr:cytidylate kinase family protein [Patescibacteria group bacterium]